MDGIDPDRLDEALRVLREAEQLPTGHPDAIALQRATSGMYKAARKRKKREIQSAIREHDDAVIANTATGAPGRIDDETQY